MEVQIKAKCIIGEHYPKPIVDHTKASKHNKLMMKNLRESAMGKTAPPHCRPSDESEAKSFLGLPTECHDHCKGSIE